MERTPKLIAGILLIAIAAVTLGVYAYFQFREYLRGPVLTIEEPLDGTLSTTSIVMLRGNARNASFITLNGRQIFTDERGRFNESLLLQDGYSIMTFEAKDRFGHRVEKRLELVYNQRQNQNGNIPNLAEPNRALGKMENGTTTAPQF